VSEKTALVTGASRGIGLAIAERYRLAGYRTITPSRAEMDLADCASVERFISSNAAAEVDVLINNAGENNIMALENVSVADLTRMLAINVTAPFLLTRSFGAAMARRGGGHIVNISSIYSALGRAGRSMYSTCKSALNGATRAAAIELGPRNVIVNSVCPGFVDTDLTRKNNTPETIAQLVASVPLKRLATAAEIADFVFFLGSGANTFVTAQTLMIDGGFSIQ